MVRPSSSMTPAAVGMNPAIDLSSVDLPHPDGPRRMNRSLRSTENVTPSTAVKTPCSVGYAIVTSRTPRRLIAGRPVEVLERVVPPGRGHRLDHPDPPHEGR